MNIRRTWRTAAKTAALLTLLVLILKLTPESTLNAAGTILDSQLEWIIWFFLTIFILLGVVMTFVRVLFSTGTKLLEYIDPQGFPEFANPMKHSESRFSRHLAVIYAMREGVAPTENSPGFSPSPKLALLCAIFPFASTTYQHVAEQINADKTYPFHHGIVAPKVNASTGAVITQYSRHLADYLDTTGRDLGFNYQVYDPEKTPPTPSGEPRKVDMAIKKVGDYLGTHRWVRIALCAAAYLLVLSAITVILPKPESTFVSITLGLFFGVLIAFGLRSKPLEPQVIERMGQIQKEIERERSNLIIEPGARQWRALAAQILAITDYVHMHARPREEALGRIELVLRSNIFQVEDVNATPEQAYEWARAELYDFSAVSVSYPNGYQVSGEGHE